jgi:hypothetical protein
MPNSLGSSAEELFNRKLDVEVRVLARALEDAIDLARVRFQI